MTDVLYGMDPAAVLTDPAGNIQTGRTGYIHTTFTGNNPFTATKTADPTTLAVGAGTAGTVVSGTGGRIGFYATDYYDTLYVDFGQGARWPLSPTRTTDRAVQTGAIASGAAAAALASAVATAAADATAKANARVAKGEIAFDVRDYGAVGDGKADDTAACQAALNAAMGAGIYLRGGRVFFPLGRYRITGTLQLTDAGVEMYGAGWGYSDTSTHAAQGSALVWDGGNAPMIQVTGGRGFKLADLMLVGNKDPAKRPTAGLRFYIGATQTFKNGLARVERVSFGKLSGIMGFSLTDVALDNGILFDGQVDVQNDSSVIEQCRFDGCTIGIQTTATQSVLHDVKDCLFLQGEIGIKTTSQMRVVNANFGNMRTRDLEISTNARVALEEFASEQAGQFALLSTSAALTVRGGYWQASPTMRADRIWIDSSDDSNTYVRLSNVRIQANNLYTTPNLKPIIRMQPATNNVRSQKILELDNLRYLVVQPYTGIDESMFMVTTPAGSNSSVTVFGSIQPPTPGGISLDEGANKWFFNILRNGAALSFNRDDRTANRLATGYYRTPRGSTGTTRALTQSTEYAVPIELAPGQTIDRVALNITTAAAGATLRFGLRQDNNGVPAATVTELGTADASTTGIKELTVAQPVAGARVWVSVVAQGAAGVVATGINGGVPGVDAATSALLITTYAAITQTGVTGALPAAMPTNQPSGTGPLIGVRAAS